MLNRAAPALRMTAAQRSTLLTLTRSTSTPPRQALRARALMLAADGAANDRIAAELGLSATTVRSWRSRFVADGLAQLGRVRPGQGAKPTITAETVEAIVWATEHSEPTGHPHWSCQAMADQFGVSAASVYRIWRARGLKPHLAQSNTSSADLMVATVKERLTDVVGGYLDPTVKILALCIDDKSQFRAVGGLESSTWLDQRSIGTGLDDCRRNSTTMLFAALDVLIRSQHDKSAEPSGGEILSFLVAVDQAVPDGMPVRLILDNETTHRDAKVAGWLDRNPRFQLLFTPTTYSWLTLVEGWFRQLATQAPRGSFSSVPELIAAIEDNTVDTHNPSFVWTSTADRIRAKASGGRGTLQIAVGQ